MHRIPEVFKRHVSVVNSGLNSSVVYLVRSTVESDGNPCVASMLIQLLAPDSVVIGMSPKEKHLYYTKNNPGLVSSIDNHGFCQGLFEKFVCYLLSDDKHFIPTGDFQSAIAQARRSDCHHITLGDRPLYITVCRLISTLGWIKCIKIIVGFYCRAATSYITGRGRIGSISNYDVLVSLVTKLINEYPEGKEVLIDERNKYFTYILQKHAGFQLYPTHHLVKLTPKLVLAVVNVCDIPGIRKYWGTVTKVEYEQLTKLQPQSKSTKIIKFVIELSVFSLLFWGLLKMPDELKPIVVTKWILSMF